jgi:1,4-dihydroxy-2-naphthoate octaprenyltransferase
MRRFLAFIKLGRPKFLVGGFVLYGLGAALAVRSGAALAVQRGGTFDLGRFIWGQLVVTAAQLMTHYANDYFDLAADRANRTPTQFSGGSRVLVGQVLRPVVALRAARVLALIAGGAALVVARRGGGGIVLPIAIAMIGLAWGYSAPPLRLCARGLGEVTTALVVTLLVPLFGYVLQAGAPAAPIFLAAALPCALQFAMLLAIEFPDAAGDGETGKRTLVVRMGAAAAARLYAAITIGAFGVLPLLAYLGLPARIAAAPVLIAPVAIWQALRVARGSYGDPARWESVAFWAVALLIASSGLELAATLAGG